MADANPPRSLKDLREWRKQKYLQTKEEEAKGLKPPEALRTKAKSRPKVYPVGGYPLMGGRGKGHAESRRRAGEGYTD